MPQERPAGSPVLVAPVLVARPVGRGAELVSRLREQGLPARHVPLVALVPAAEGVLAAARTRLAEGGCTHLVVTSRTTAEVLGATTVPEGTTVIAVGEGTAAALRAHGLVVDRVAGGSGAALVAQMPPAEPGARVLLPASAAASRTVPDGLRAKGYLVEEIAVYSPEPLDPSVADARALSSGDCAALVLTSPLIAHRAAELGVRPTIPLITIGEPTSAAVRAAGLTVARQAPEPTDPALARAVLEVLGTSPSAAALPRPPHRPKESR